MAKLTHMQQKVYDYIVSCIQTQGYPPSVREIGDAVMVLALFLARKESATPPMAPERPVPLENREMLWYDRKLSNTIHASRDFIWR